MQLLHWLIRATHEKGIEHQDSTSSSTTSTTNKKGNKVNEVLDHHQQNTKRLIVLKRDNKSGSKGKNSSDYKKHLKLFWICRKDVAKSCFYSTINLKSPSKDNTDVVIRSSREYWIDSMKTKKQDVIAKALVIGKVDPTGSTKVLPINETTTTILSSTSKISTSSNDQISSNYCSTSGALEKKEKAKTMSRMKELLRWAAAAKSENKGGKFIGRKVLQFRNRSGNPKAISDDQFSIESPKISFRWDLESCSTTSSVYSAISVTSLKNNPNLSMLSLSSATNNNHSPKTRKGNWITTDSEFVVLEL